MNTQKKPATFANKRKTLVNSPSPLSASPSAPQNKTVAYQKKPALMWLGYLLISVGCILFISVLFRIPSGYWNQSFKVRWYVVSGAEVVNNQILPTTSLIPPDKGDALTQIALEMDPSFFAQSPSNKKIFVDNYPGVLDFRAKLYVIDEYKEIAVNLWHFEVIPNSRPRNGYIAAILSAIFGTILIILSRRKPYRE